VTGKMQSTDENSFSIPAWGVSLALHGGVVWLAVLFTAQVKPVLVEEVFKWDIALVEPVKSDSTSELMPPTAPAPVEQVVPPLQAPRVAAPRSAEPPPEHVVSRVGQHDSIQ